MESRTVSKSKAPSTENEFFMLSVLACCTSRLLYTRGKALFELIIALLRKHRFKCPDRSKEILKLIIEKIMLAT